MKAKIYLYMKHDDTASMIIDNEKGTEILDHQGYMPAIGIFDGDTTELQIDNETGTIIGWQPITQEDLDGLKEDESEEEESEE